MDDANGTADLFVPLKSSSGTYFKRKIASVHDCVLPLNGKSYCPLHEKEKYRVVFQAFKSWLRRYLADLCFSVHLLHCHKHAQRI